MMDTRVQEEEKVWIPAITDERLQELFCRIKPVVNFGKKGFRRGLRYIKPVSLRDVAYTWNPKPKKKARRLKFLGEIITYHTCGHYDGHYDLFKPSIADVLAQISEEDLDDVIAFEILDYEDMTYEPDREREAFNAGYHAAITRLYSR